MNSGVEFELRLPRLPARAAVFAWLMLCCAETTISENMTISTHYPVPSGIYSGLTVTGRTPAGAGVDSFLTSGPGGDIGIRTAGADPLAKLVVGTGGGVQPGAMVVGSNVAPPGSPGTTQVLHTTNGQPACAGAPGAGNICSGISYKSRNSGDRWAMFPEGGSLRVRYTASPGDGPGSQVMVFGAGGIFTGICMVRSYSMTTGGVTQTQCPAGHYVFGPWTGTIYVSSIYYNGSMLCCRILEQ